MTTTMKKPHTPKGARGKKGTKDRAPEPTVTKLAPRPLTPLIAVVPEIRKVDLSRIIDPPGAPDRMEREGDHERIVALAESLRQYQQQSPIAVEELADGRLVRIYGRRRIKAATLAGWNQIEARVYPPLQEDVRRALVAIEKECGRQFALFDAWRDGHSGVVDLIAKALGVDLPEPPSVESFYPKDLKAAAKSQEPEPDADDESDDESDEGDEDGDA